MVLGLLNATVMIPGLRVDVGLRKQALGAGKVSQWEKCMTLTHEYQRKSGVEVVATFNTSAQETQTVNSQGKVASYPS